MALEKLEALPTTWEKDPNLKHELKILPTDVHRKFQKATRSGQLSIQPPMSEKANFNKMRDALENPDKQQWIKELKSYFMLFGKEANQNK